MFQYVLLWMLPSSFRILGGNNEWVHVYNDNNAQLNNTFATTPDRYHTHTHTPTKLRTAIFTLANFCATMSYYAEASRNFNIFTYIPTKHHHIIYTIRT